MSVAIASPQHVSLPDFWRTRLRADGFLHLTRAISTNAVAQALGTVNAAIGEYGVRAASLPSLKDDSFVPEVRRADDIMHLLNGSGLADTIAEHILPDGVQPVRTSQIALRFPGEDKPVVPHVDGLLAAPFSATSARAPLTVRPQAQLDEQTAQRRLHTFTALVGVYLSDVVAADAGNLVVWPGSHDAVSAFYRERGPNGLFDGMPPVEHIQPVALKAQAGDVIIANYSLAHAIAPNRSPHIRYAVYFRLYAHQHEERAWECLVNPWLEWAV